MKLGIDIGASHIGLGLVKNNQIIQKKYIPYKWPPKLFNKIFNNYFTNKYINNLIKEIDCFIEDKHLTYIGICCPGGVDTNFRAVANHTYLKPETVAKMIKACIENEEGCVHDLVIRPFIEENMA